jgi:threonine/homoserine/homoserine lactone efflux protein
MVTNAAAFLAVSAVVIVTPGQDTALTIRNTLLGGHRGGIATALGVASGQSLWALATGVGLAAVLAASETAFTAVRLAGAAYLILLGLQTLLRARRRERGPHGARPGRPAPAARKAFRQGVLSNLGNAKMAVFFPSLLPQFAAPPSFPSLLGLGLVFACMTLTWLTAYAVVVARARAVLVRGRVRRLLDAVTGTVLVALGLRLASER